MNLAAHGLHKTWPHGTVRIALMVFDRFLSHAGQMMLGASVDDLVSGTVLKCIETKDFSERLCLLSGADAGHNGDSFGGLAS